MKKRLVAILCVVMLAFSFILSSCSIKDITRLFSKGDKLIPSVVTHFFNPDLEGKEGGIGERAF